MVSVKELDKLVNKGETLREFIRNSENMFGLEPLDLDDMTDEALNEYVDFLDSIWTK